MSQQPNWDVFNQDIEETPDEEYFTEQAEFCLATGFVQPSEYDEMTRTQLSAWIEVLNKRTSK